MAKKEASVKSENELADVFKMLSNGIHPLVLGAVNRARNQIKFLARMLLNYHLSDPVKVDKVIKTLLEERFSHDYIGKSSLGVKIIESTSYRENIFYKNRVEYTTYTYTVPGVSVEDLAQTYYTFKPCMADCENALELLLRRDIISPIMDFRGKTRYVIADPALTDFVTEFSRFCELENEFLNFEWQYLTRPTSNEEQSRRLFYSDETESAKFFNVRELQRYQFKQAVKKNNEEILKLQTRLEEYPHRFEKIRLEYLNYINEKHRWTINKYHFLREIIQIISPLLHNECV